MRHPDLLWRTYNVIRILRLELNVAIVLLLYLHKKMHFDASVSYRELRAT